MRMKSYLFISNSQKDMNRYYFSLNKRIYSNYMITNVHIYNNNKNKNNYATIIMIVIIIIVQLIEKQFNHIFQINFLYEIQKKKKQDS